MDRVKRDVSMACPAPWRRVLAAFLAGSVGCAAATGWVPPGALAQVAPPGAATAPRPVPTAGAEARLTQPQLEQLLAPIALYPDELLTQVLMAATYPLEVVQAMRWLGQGQNGALRGDALARALNDQPWDPSVKSLVPFPDVLTLMNDQLEWTQQVGDAVLAQQDDVLNTVQVLRGRAQANGALQSGEQQTVNVTQNVNVTPAAGAAVAPPPQVITIAPTNPETVYVPAYNPNVVYGSWPYPQYPPTYYPPPVGWGVGNAILTGMAFAGGVAIVSSLWGWGRPNWGRGNININININTNRYNDINVNRTRITSGTWQHDVAHRGGVAYRSPEVRDRYRATGAATSADRVQAREQFRGRTQQVDRAAPAARPGPAERAAPGAGRERSAAADRTPGGGRVPQGTQRDGARPGAADRATGAAGAIRPGADRQGAAATRPAPGQPSGAEGRAAARPESRQPQPQARQPQQQARQPAPSMQGIGQGGSVRAAEQRGAVSRQTQPSARPAAGDRAGARTGGVGGRQR